MSQSHHWRSVLIVLILTAIRSLYISELLLKFPQNSGCRFYVGLCAITAYWRVIPGICWLFMLMQLFSHEKLLRTAGRHHMIHMSIVSLHWTKKTFDWSCLWLNWSFYQFEQQSPHVLIHGWYFNHWTFSRPNRIAYVVFQRQSKTKCQ